LFKYKYNMADEERPPTQEEIKILRSLISNPNDNEEACMELADYNRFMNQDDYVARFFLHCTDIPGDHLKNTEDMILRSFKFRKEKAVRSIQSADLDEGLKAKGSLYLRNRDADGKQLLIFDVKKHIKGSANMDDMQKMFLYFLERVDREDADGMVTIVFDCAGCGLKNMDMEFIRYMIDVLKDYYPFCLNYILVLDMPWVLNAAWKIIKAWLPAGAVKKIKFVNKNTVDEYVHPEQKLLAWGGSDPWEYEFIEERTTNPEPDEVETNINGNGNEISTSEEEEVLRQEVNTTDVLENSSTSMSIASTTSTTLVESEHRVSLNTMANVTYSEENEKEKSEAEYEVSPENELVFLKSPKGLMATISITNKSNAPMAFKIKTTSPERYRVRPSLGLVANLATIKIDVFYQPIIPDTDDFSDVLKDKFLINLYKNSSETSYKTDSKEKKPSSQHRLKASVKKSLLKAPPSEKKELPAAASIDKDKDVYLKELRNLERKHQLMEEELKTNLFYTRITFILTVILAFMMLLQLYLGNTACPADHETFHTMTAPNLDVGDSNSEL